MRDGTQDGEQGDVQGGAQGDEPVGSRNREQANTKTDALTPGDFKADSPLDQPDMEFPDSPDDPLAKDLAEEEKAVREHEQGRQKELLKETPELSGKTKGNSVGDIDCISISPESSSEAVWDEIFEDIRTVDLSQDHSYLHNEFSVYATSQNLSDQLGRDVRLRGRKNRSMTGGEILLFVDTSASMGNQWKLGIAKCAELIAARPESKLILRVLVFSDSVDPGNEFIYWNSLVMHEDDLSFDSVLFEDWEVPERQRIDIGQFIGNSKARLMDLVTGKIACGCGTEFGVSRKRVEAVLGFGGLDRFKLVMVITDGWLNLNDVEWARSTAPTATYGENFTWLFVSNADRSSVRSFNGRSYFLDETGKFIL